MKRIAFSYIEKTIDFTTYAEAKRFMEKARNAGKAIVNHYNNNLGDGFTYTVVIREKYKNYEIGF